MLENFPIIKKVKEKVTNLCSIVYLRMQKKIKIALFLNFVRGISTQ